MRRALADAEEIVLPGSLALRIGPRSLDQGRTGTCGGHAFKNWSRCEPIMTEAKTAPSPWDFYRWAVAHDNFPENDREGDLPDGDEGMSSGTSTRACAEAAIHFGMGKTYVWTFAVQPMLEFMAQARALGKQGGSVTFGANWYSSMNRPDDEGIARITPTARIEGGHLWLVRGYNLRRGLGLCENSWGDGWGKNGAFWVPLRDLERLMHEDGEACALIEEKWKPKTVAPPKPVTTHVNVAA